jgi:Ras-related protein Rab-23
MECDDLETIVKVIVVGNGGVGKSSLTARYCKGTFTSTYKKTIGVDFLEKTLDSGLTTGESVKLMIWDTAGQEEFDSITASYYRGAGACAIVFSSTDRASFEAVERWKQKVEAEFEGKTYPILCLVQNKADLIDSENGGSGVSGGNGNNAQMSAIEVESLAKRLNMRLFRTSVKLDTNVKDVFEHLATEYILRSQAPPMVSKQSEEKTSDTKSGSISSSISISSSSNLNNSSSTSSLSSSVSSSAAATTISSSINKDKSLGIAMSTPSTNTVGGGGGGGLSNALLPPDVLARVNESNGLPAPAGTIRLGSSSEKQAKKKKTGLFGGC